MNELTPSFDPIKLRKYPHMFVHDIAIWERFLDEHGKDFTGFSYDIKVGTGTTLPKKTPEEYRRMADILSRYRIDAVGFKANQIEIIEVKPEASTVAIGQVITYVDLYRRDYNPTVTIVGAIVTDRHLPDIAYLTNLHGINYYVV